MARCLRNGEDILPVLILKKDVQSCSNFRSIKLICATMKICGRVVGVQKRVHDQQV